MERVASVNAHLSEEMIEEYCFNRLPAEATAALEDHLLVCVACQLAVQDQDEYILLMKLATREFSRAGEIPLPDRNSPKIPEFASGTDLAPAFAAELNDRRVPVPRLSNLREANSFRSEPARRFATKPRLVTSALCATALGLSCVAGLMLLRSEPSQPVAAVPLSAFRGGGDRFLAHAPAATPLDLQADITDLPEADVLTADMSGAKVSGAELHSVNAYRLEVVDVAGRPVWGQSIPVSSRTLSAHVSKGLRAGVYWVRIYSRSGELLREFSLRLDDPVRHH